MPRDPWTSSYGNGSPEQAAAPRSYSSFPTRRQVAAPAPGPPDGDQYGDPSVPSPACAAQPGPGRRTPGPRGGRGRRGALIIVLMLTLVVALGGAALAVLLLLGGSDPAPGAASPRPTATATPPEAGELPVPTPLTGTATLSDPIITVPKTPLPAADQWCSLLTADDIRAVTGFEQRGLPDGTLLCTHYLADDAGYLFVSDIPASEGAAYAVRGNSAIVYQSNPAACEVTVALNRGGGVLDIDVRGVISPRVPLCHAAMSLAARAFDRLPTG